MKANLRKIFVIVLALALVFAFSISAFADEYTDEPVDYGLMKYETSQFTLAYVDDEGSMMFAAEFPNSSVANDLYIQIFNAKTNELFDGGYFSYDSSYYDYPYYWSMLGADYTSYKYRVCEVLTFDDGTYAAGPWSDYNYMVDSSAKYQRLGSGKGVKITLKGMKDVKYKIYVSTSSTKKGNLVKTVTPTTGKKVSYTINYKSKSTKMSKGKKYYVTVVPVYKGHVSDLVKVFNFKN